MWPAFAAHVAPRRDLKAGHLWFGIGLDKVFGLLFGQGLRWEFGQFADGCELAFTVDRAAVVPDAALFVEKHTTELQTLASHGFIVGSVRVTW